MQALSRNLLFAVSSALAVSAIAFISWRIADQNPRLFSKLDASRPIATEPATPLVNPGSQAAPTPDAKASQAVRQDASPGAPAFDIVRVEPSGEAVVAGRALPNAA